MDREKLAETITNALVRWSDSHREGEMDWTLGDQARFIADLLSPHLVDRETIRREALEEAADAAAMSDLPEGYRYGREAYCSFAFGRRRAVEAIHALLTQETPTDAPE